MLLHSKILVIAPSWVGDAVMAQSLFKLLKQQDSTAVIHVLTTQNLSTLFAFMPEVEQVLSAHFQRGALQLGMRYKLALTLRKERYDRAILLPNSFKSALIPFLAHIPVRTGWRGEQRYILLNDLRFLSVAKYPLMVQRFAALGLSRDVALPECFHWPSLLVTKDMVTQLSAKFRLSLPTKPVLALCLGAEYGPAKRWPTEHFAEVAQAKVAAGWEVWLFGSTKEQSLAAEVQTYTNNTCVNFVGRTTLAEAIILLSLATAAVTNDSGLLHIVAALGLPVVAVYGSTSPQFTPPLTETARVLALDLPCKPCGKRDCPLGHLQCLWGIEPSVVLDALDSFQVDNSTKLK